MTRIYDQRYVATSELRVQFRECRKGDVIAVQIMPGENYRTVYSWIAKQARVKGVCISLHKERDYYYATVTSTLRRDKIMLEQQKQQ